MNKVSRGDGIPVELFQILKDDAVKVLHSICLQFWKTQQWPQEWKRSVFIATPKKGNATECSYYGTIAFILHANKVMLKILQSRLQQCMNCELPDVQSGFRKGSGTRDQIAHIHWIIIKKKKKKERERENSRKKKNLCPLYWLSQSLWLCGSQKKNWKILKEIGIADHLFCLLRNLYAGQEATVRTGHPITFSKFVIVILPKTHLTSHSRMSGVRWVTIQSWLSVSLGSFCMVILCILANFS